MTLNDNNVKGPHAFGKRNAVRVNALTTGKQSLPAPKMLYKPRRTNQTLRNI